MKIKHITLLIFFLTFTISYSQSDKKIYDVIFFKWTKFENKDLMKVVRVDSVGNIYLSNKPTGQKVEMASFTTAINKYVKKEKLEKIPGSDEPPRMSLIPKDGEQTIEISVVFLEDFKKETHLANNTYYSLSKTGLKLYDSNYSIFKYLSKNDSARIKKLLE